MRECYKSVRESAVARSLKEQSSAFDRESEMIRGRFEKSPVDLTTQVAWPEGLPSDTGSTSVERGARATGVFSEVGPRRSSTQRMIQGPALPGGRQGLILASRKIFFTSP